MARLQHFGFLAALTLATVGQAAVVHYGNDVYLGTDSSHAANYLLGSKYAVASPITLQSAGIIFRSQGYNAKVGIYTDVAGTPGALVAQTAAFAVTSVGVVEKAFTATPVIPAGNYWFMAVYDQDASVGITYNTSDVVDYAPLAFASTLPAVFPTLTTYTGQAFNYYLVGNTTIPEPTGLAVLGGLMALGLRRR